MSSNPFEPPHQTGDGMPPAVDVTSIVSGPAIGLLVAGIINVLTSIYFAFNGLFALLMGDKMLQNDPRFDEVQDMPNAPDMQTIMQISGAGYVALGILGVIIGAVIIRGAWNMKNLKNHGSAMIAAVLAVIPVLSCCCFVGMPMGIWSLMVLNKPEVRAGFK